MKSALGVILLLISAAAAFVFLTVNVGTKDIGGITGTMVVAPGTSDQDIRQLLSVLRIAGFGWSVIGFGCLVWILRSRGGSAQRPGRTRPIMFRLGLVLFGVGIIGGLFLALFFGPHSAEFTNFFGYFVALWMLATMLIFLGRPQRRLRLSPGAGTQSRSVRCSGCGKRLLIISNMLVRREMIMSSKGCFRCAVCGLYTCYECSDNRNPCKHGHQQWERLTYVEA